jgi:hypothetical protein
MPSPSVQEGHAATLTFATSGYAPNVQSINTPGMTRDALETTHLGTVGAKTFIPAALVDNGELSFSVQVNPDALPPIAAAPETITITFAGDGVDTTDASWAFTGFITAVGEAALNTGAILVQDITVKVSGTIIPTAATT